MLLTAVQQFGLGIQAVRSSPRWLQAILVVIAVAVIVLTIVGLIPGRVLLPIVGVAVGLIYAIGVNREIQQQAGAEPEDPDEQS